MKFDEQYWFNQEEVTQWREKRRVLGAEYKEVCENLAATKSTLGTNRRFALIERQKQLTEQCRELNEKIKAVDLLSHQEKLTEYEIDPRDGRGLIANAVGLITRLRLEIRKHNPTFRMEEKDSILFNVMQEYAQHNIRSVPTKVAFVKEQIEH